MPNLPARAVQFRQAGFCRFCGWLLKKQRTYDPRSGIVMEKFVCTNSRCGRST
jgi:hypothetical protein